MGSAGDLTRGTPHAAANLIVCAVRMCQSVLASCTAEFDPQDALLACGAAWARPCLLHIGRMQCMHVHLCEYVVHSHFSHLPRRLDVQACMRDRCNDPQVTSRGQRNGTRRVPAQQ